MATDVLSETNHIPEKSTSTPRTIPETTSSTSSSTSSSGTQSALDSLTTTTTTRIQTHLDHVFPPSQRQDFLDKIKAFALANPKLAVRTPPTTLLSRGVLTPHSQAFLATNVALTAVPLTLFTFFAIFGGLFIGLCGAIIFTLVWVGIALAVLLPVLIFTTTSACFLSLFGLGGYQVLKWASAHDASGSKAEEGQNSRTVGEGLKATAGGRLIGLLDSAEAQRGKDDTKGPADQNAPPAQPPALGTETKTSTDAPAKTSDMT